MSAELHRAILALDLDTLARLLASGHDPNEFYEVCVPLHNAIGEFDDGRDIEAVALLLRHGADPNIWTAGHNATPLLFALFDGRRDVALMLLAAGADPNVRGGEGEIPLCICAERGDLKMAATLLRAGAAKTIEESAGGGAGMKALGWAAYRLNLEMIRLLLAWGASLTAWDVDRCTAQERLPDRTEENAEKWDLAFKLLSPTS
jgi:ankyrin repeat protein